MAKYISNINTDATRIVPTVDRGWWTVTSDPGKVADGGIVPQEWTNVLMLIQALSSDQKLALTKALGLSNSELTALIKANAVTDTSTLANIAIGTVADTQRNAIRNALQLVDDSPVIKGFLADDRQKIVYYGGNLYGVKRLLYSDVTSINERSGYESSGVAKAISGSGDTSLSSSSNQWITYNFSAKNVFSIKLRHTNNNWATRKLNINYTAKNLASWAATHTYSYLPVNGWQSISRLQVVDDAPGNTVIHDLEVLYSDSVAPTLINGQQLEINDFFKVENTSQYLRFEGVDPASGAWKAVPVSNNLQVDSALSPISTNALQNRVINSALDELRRSLGDRIDAIGIVDELQSWIEKQLLFNAIVVNRIDDLYERLARK